MSEGQAPRESHVLKDDAERKVVREGDTVRRPTYPWTPAVHSLLQHLEDVGFPYAPRLLGTDNGHEILTFIEGESGLHSWAKVVDERGLWAMGRLLRMYHQAVWEWEPDESLIWAAGTMNTGDPSELICHGDFGPWNGVWRGQRIIGLIDFDHARPAPPIFDIAYALEYAAPFRDDSECLRWLHYPQPPDRRRRIEIFCDAYGITVPGDIVGRVAWQQRLVLEHCQALARQGIEPQATWIREGYLDTIRARIDWTESLSIP